MILCNNIGIMYAIMISTKDKIRVKVDLHSYGVWVPVFFNSHIHDRHNLTLTFTYLPIVIH